MRIREAELRDAAAMARVSVESYRAAHRDQIPEKSLMQFTQVAYGWKDVSVLLRSKK